jgi:hypothetical protein
MLTSLKEIHNMLEEVNQLNDNKEELLRKHLENPIFGKTLKRVLEYITDKKHLFRLKRIHYRVFFEDKFAAEQQHVDGIFKMLDSLSEKVGDYSDEEILFFERVSSSDPETIEVINRILNKYSSTGLTNEQIIKVLEEKNENNPQK